MTDDLDRERYRRLERPQPGPPPVPSSAATQLVQVFQETLLPTSPGHFFATHPVVITGNEVEGGPATVTPSADVMYVDVIGPGVPGIGDLLIAKSQSWRWTASFGKATKPVQHARLCFDLAACEISPDSSIGATVTLFGRAGGVDTTIGSVTTDANYPAQFCFDVPSGSGLLGFKLSHPQYPDQMINPTTFAFPSASQALTIVGSPTSGTFTYSVPIDGLSYTTPAITFSTTITTLVHNIQAALNTALGVGNSKVAFVFGKYQITFTGLYSGRAIPTGTVNPTLNTGSITVSTVQGGGFLAHLNLGSPTGYTCVCTGLTPLSPCPSALNTRPPGSPAGYAIPTTLVLNDGLGDVNVTINPGATAGWVGCAMRTATWTDPFVGFETSVSVPVFYFVTCYNGGFQVVAYYPMTSVIGVGGGESDIPFDAGIDCSASPYGKLYIPWLFSGSSPSLLGAPFNNLAGGLVESTWLRSCHPFSAVFTSKAFTSYEWVDGGDESFSNVFSPATDTLWGLAGPQDLAQFIWGSDAQTWTLAAP